MISCKRRRFPPKIIAHAVWLYCRFNLSLREIEELFLQRVIDVSYETIRRWVVNLTQLLRGACSASYRSILPFETASLSLHPAVLL